MIKTALAQGEEAALECLIEVCEIRDNLLSQAFKALLYRKVVLWMDLDILDTGYVKGDILEAVQNIFAFKNKHNYLPTRIEYVHPKRASELPPLNDPAYKPPVHLNITSLFESFTEEYSSIISLIEHNFKLKNVKNTQKSKLKSPKVDSLRQQLEEVYREKEKLEEEIQKLRIQMRNPDRREWHQNQRDLEEKEQQLEHGIKNIQKLMMEKFALETENLQLKQHTKQIESKLGKINEVYLPRLEEAEKLHAELSVEIRNIRQDAELLPGMFRNEAFMKKKIRDEKIFTEEKMNEALSCLEEERQRFAVLLEEKNRKDRVALQAVGARNAIEKQLKNAISVIEELKKQIQSQVSHEDEMRSMVEMYKKRHDEMQEHVYVQNNRINELEDQKKVLIQQIKETGNRSQAHYTYKPIKGTS